jgi:nickel-dependent lactate racemase
LKKNGTVILFAECREGSGSKLFEKMMPAFPTPEAILTHLSTGEVVDDQWAVQFLATFIRDINVFVVSTGLTRELAEILHVNLFGSAKAAFDEAVKRAPSDYRIAIIENPDVLVVNKE